MKKIIWYIDRDEQIGKVVESEFPKITDDYEAVVINNPIVIDEKLKEQLPHLIFIDTAIAEQDDAIIIKDLRSHKGMEKIPIVLIGHDIRIGDRAAQLQVESLRKPFDMKQFFEKVKEVLKK